MAGRGGGGGAHARRPRAEEAKNTSHETCFLLSRGRATNTTAGKRCAKRRGRVRRASSFGGQMPPGVTRRVEGHACASHRTARQIVAAPPPLVFFLSLAQRAHVSASNYARHHECVSVPWNCLFIFPHEQRILWPPHMNSDCSVQPLGATKYLYVCHGYCIFHAW